MDFQGSWLRGERCAFKRDAHKRGRSSARGRGRSPSRKGNSVMTFLREPQEGALQACKEGLSVFFLRKAHVKKINAISGTLIALSPSKERDTKEYVVLLHVPTKSMLDGRGREPKIFSFETRATVEGKAKRTATQRCPQYWRLQKLRAARRSTPKPL